VKVTTEHRALIADAIAGAGLDTPAVRARYAARDIPRGDAVQDIDKRFRWDLFRASSLVTVDGRTVHLIGLLYDAGYHDGHIDTALRSIVPAL
jgi:hypothetical protein